MTKILSTSIFMCPIIVSLPFFMALNLVAFSLYLSSHLSTKKTRHLILDKIMLGK